MNINTIDLTPLLEALIAILAAVITMYVIPWIKSRTTVSQQEYIRAAAKVAVYSAEKFYGAGKGNEKLAYAQKVLEEDYGITLNMNKLEAVIDATIKEMEQTDPLKIIEALPAETTGEGGVEEDKDPQREDAPKEV